MLKCKNINYSVDEIKILEGVSFDLKAGEKLIITGASGTGKSTLLHILSGLLEPTGGSITYGNLDLYKKSQAEIDKFRAQNIGVIFQQFHLIKPFTVMQNLLLAFSFSGVEQNQKRISEALNNLGLAGRENQKAETLSIGQSQRLAVARAIICEPKWIFCDEPTSALDDTNCDAMLKLLDEQSKDASLIIATHDARVKKYFKKAKQLNLEAVT